MLAIRTIAAFCLKIPIFVSRCLRGPESPLSFDMNTKDEISGLVKEHLSGTDCFLVDVKLSPGKLMVAIDKPTGITIEECSSLSRYLLDRFEGTGFLETHEVEVGSPGMDAPLLVPQQYRRRIGRELRVFDTFGHELNGILKQVNEEGIELLVSKSRKENKKKIITETLHTIPFSEIREAKLILNFKLK